MNRRAFLRSIGMAPIAVVLPAAAVAAPIVTSHTRHVTIITDNFEEIDRRIREALRKHERNLQRNLDSIDSKRFGL